MKTTFSVLLILFLYISPVYGQDTGLHNHVKGIWSIESTAEQDRWIVIHNLEEGIKTGIYHVEVIGRVKDDPVWKITRLVNHMAVTEKALKDSVVKPLEKGAVYPEAFDDAYTQWLSQNSDKGGAICNTSIIDCMKQK